MTSFFRKWRRSPRLAPSRERQSLRQRRTHIEGLEPRLVLSHNGELDIVFAMPSAMAAQMSENMDVAAAATIFPGEEISYDTLPNGLPILDSFPSAPSAIYLDFTGGNYHGSESVPPYDTDGNPAVYGLSEQLAIYEAWRQV